MKVIFSKIKIFTLILCFTVSINGYYASNGSPCAFNENCPEGTSGGTSYASGLSVTSETNTLSYLIREGGGSFLHSIGYINIFLAKLETGQDYATVLNEIDSAIKNMKDANSLYYQLIAKAATIPYNNSVIDQLIDFNYDKLRKDKRLNYEIFDKVQAYLSTGDVRGVYFQMYENSFNILIELSVIRNELSFGLFPLEKKWRLNQLASEAKLFGQYVSEVFYKIQ